MKDRIGQEKLLNGNPAEEHAGKPDSEASATVESIAMNPKGGIIKITRDTHESEQESYTIQEQHNAHHALYFFSMIADGVVYGRSTGDDGEKLKRIKEHMMNLREFIGGDKANLKAVVNLLLNEVERFSPGGRKQFARFIFTNWTLIHSFAEVYGYHERCFPDAKYEKLRDIVFGGCYFKSWWWKIRAQRLSLVFRKSLRQLASKVRKI
jgi:hypothetical protein